MALGLPYDRSPYSAARGALAAGVGRYREAAFVADADDPWESWGDYANRKLRYAIFQAHVEGSAYRCIQAYAEGMKADHDLYSYVRPVLSPAYRCVEFWSQHLMGGILDPDAGDGKARPSCLPIITANEAIRPALTQIWRDSNWQSYKDVWTLNGASMGDAPMLIVDDPYRQSVYFKPIHPGTVRECERDDYGNVKGYVLEETRVHPDADRINGDSRTAIYSEECRKVGGRIVYTTYLDHEPHDWRYYHDGYRGRVFGPTWTEDYDFVPMVIVQHRNRGLGWGWSELQPSKSKLQELDDMASKFNDGFRTNTKPRWFLAGIDPETRLDFTSEDDDSEDSDPDTIDRNSEDSIKAKDPGARPWPMVAALDVAGGTAHLASILAAIEKDHPELTASEAGLNASGTARRIAQQRLEASVVQRRAGYDDGLVRAHKMAISIGAIKEYPGLEGFDEGSFLRGELDHSIGDRPVFAVDEMDRLEESQARATVYKTLVDGGMPIGDAADEAGYPPERVEKLVKAQMDAEAKAKRAEDVAAKAQADRASRVATVEMPGEAVDANPGDNKLPVEAEG